MLEQFRTCEHNLVADCSISLDLDRYHNRAHNARSHRWPSHDRVFFVNQQILS